MRTVATICTGGGGGSLGAQAAGLAHLWGVEWDPAIAAVAMQNGCPAILVADMRAMNYAALPVPDLLLVTPDCTRASQANPNAGETEEDLSRADAIVQALATLSPRYFMLENVWGYVRFVSFRRILSELTQQGYWWDYHHINAADYGVPQTRKRLILRASRATWLPPLPLPGPWVGWYAAIEDLLDTLPPDMLAPWQLARLPAALGGDTLVLGSNINTRSRFTRAATEPAATVVAAPLSQLPLRALLIEGTGAHDNRTLVIRQAHEPMWTIRSAARGDTARAVLINGCNAGSASAPTCRAADEPAPTVTAQRATKQAMRAWPSQARIVRMTPRALARFQSFPDSYVLPDNLTLACRILGGAVPPLLIQRLIEGLL